MHTTTIRAVDASEIFSAFDGLVISHQNLSRMIKLKILFISFQAILYFESVNICYQAIQNITFVLVPRVSEERCRIQHLCIRPIYWTSKTSCL